MKEAFTKLVNFYNTNTLFHNFINGLEMAIGGIVAASVTAGKFPPTSKADWAALGSGLAYGLWSWWKRWSQENLATQGVPLKP